MATNSDPAAPFEGVAGAPARLRPALPAASRRGGSRFNLGRLFASVFLSLYGDWLTTVALVVVLYQLTGSAIGPAGYVLARVGPRAIGPSIGGRLADRLSARQVMVAAASLQAVLTACLVAAHGAHVLWGIYGLVGIAQFVGSVARPSQGAMLPTLVSDAALPRANATYALFFSTAIFLGPAIGAALLTRVGADALFAIDATTFLVSAVLAATLPSGVRMRAAVGSSANAQAAPFRLSTALRDPVVRLVAMSNLTTSAAVTVVQAFLVVAAHERLGSDASVGYLYAAVGVGGTLGGLVGLRSIPSRRYMRGAVELVTVVALLALAAFAASVTALFAAIALAASACATASIDVWGFTEVQRRAPPAQLGRFSAITWMAQYAGMLGGAVAALGMAPLLRWDRVVEIVCAAMVAVAAVVWMSLAFASEDPDETVHLTGWIDLAEAQRRSNPMERLP